MILRMNNKERRRGMRTRLRFPLRNHLNITGAFHNKAKPNIKLFITHQHSHNELNHNYKYKNDDKPEYQHQQPPHKYQSQQARELQTQLRACYCTRS